MLLRKANPFYTGKKEGLEGRLPDQTNYHGFTGTDKEKYIDGYFMGLSARHDARSEVKQSYYF